MVKIRNGGSVQCRLHSLDASIALAMLSLADL
jgi:hypothetical protein